MQDFAREYTPALPSASATTLGERPLYDLHGVEDEIEKALARRVDLKSGGYLIIDQTEAMTTIDVNTGGFVGGRSFDDTIFKTNLEAAQVIARQLRHAQPGRHHHHRLHRHGERRPPQRGAGRAQQGAREGPHAADRQRLHAARAWSR